MKETSVSIKGIFKWLLRKWFVIIGVTVAAAVIVTCFYAYKFNHRKAIGSSMSVTGKIIVKADGDLAASLFTEYYTATNHLVEDLSVQKNAAELYAQSGGNPELAKAVYGSCTFSCINVGIIVYTYSTDSSNSEKAAAAIDCLVRSAENALSGYPDGLSLEADKSSLLVTETKAESSFLSYLVQQKKKLVLGIFGAFALACAVYAFIYLLMTKVRDVNDLEARYDVNIIGTVPRKADKSGAYKSLVIKLRHLSDDKICYIAGNSEKIPERLYAALDGQKAAVLVYKENAESTTDVIKDSGLYYVKPDFDAKSITDNFDFVIVYIVRSHDRSFALSLLEKAESCVFAETQYKSGFEDIEDNIRDTQSIGAKVSGIILEEV